MLQKTSEIEKIPSKLESGFDPGSGSFNKF